jgi:hypothetical protein
VLSDELLKNRGHRSLVEVIMDYSLQLWHRVFLVAVLVIEPVQARTIVHC